MAGHNLGEWEAGVHVTDYTLALMALLRRQEPITPPTRTPIRLCLAMCPLVRQDRQGIRCFKYYYDLVPYYCQVMQYVGWPQEMLFPPLA